MDRSALYRAGAARKAKPIRCEGKVGYGRLFMATPAGFIPFAATPFAVPFYVNIECDYRGGMGGGEGGGGRPESVVLREESAVDSRAGQYGPPSSCRNMQTRPAFPAEYRTGIMSRRVSPSVHLRG